MSKESDNFERRVERIHQLLEVDGAVVVWNDRRPDPDNPSQLRQIDISITRDSKFTMVECRIHKNSQDVKWIEELIGRRASLRADAVIAVSASGFTEGARSKARQFGIILRDFDSLTAEEIQNWGKLKRVNVVFYEITDLLLTVHLPSWPTPPFRIRFPDGAPVDFINIIRDQVLGLESKGSLVHGSNKGEASFGMICLINGVQVEKAVVEYKMRRIAWDVSLTAVVMYADPLSNPKSPLAYVSDVPIGRAEIIEAADDVSVVMDMSAVALPPRCIAVSYGYDFGRPVRLKRSEHIGNGITLNIFESLQVVAKLTTVNSSVTYSRK